MTIISPLSNFFVAILGLGLVLLSPSTVAFVARPSTQFDIRWTDPRWQQSVDRPRSSRPPLPLSMMAEKKNRKARRLVEAQQKKSKKSGSSKGGNQPARSASDAKWLQVLDSASEIQAGSVKVVSAKYKGDEKFFALTTHAGKYFAVSEGCGRCKFPMVNGKVKVLVGPGMTEDIKEGDEQDPEASVVLVCPLCGAFFDVSTGAIAGEQTTGLVSSFVSKLVSQTAPESLKSYQAKALSTGALVVRVD